MPVLHCAKCGSKLDIYKEGGIWTACCHNCNFEVTLQGRSTTLFDVYDAFTEAITSGKLTNLPAGSTGHQRTSTSTRMRKKKSGPFMRVEAVSDIKKTVEAGGGNYRTLPPAVKALVKAGRDYLVRYKYLPATDADYGAALEDIQVSPRLREVLKAKGITRLYKFQEEAFHEIIAGNDVVIAAPTGQGKTEAFILPIMTTLVKTIHESFMNPGVRALLIYPTKALARDQFEKIKALCTGANLTVGIFDGDVTQAQRQRLYERPPDILLTNPDVLHYHLGWNRSRLVPLLRTVKIVVLDEIHLYTGSMGSNVYYIIKRLELETGSLQKIGASATVSNPKEFADLLFDSDVHLIESDKARRGPVHFMMYYPGERSKYSMITDIVRVLLRGGFKTLVFGNTHTEAELLNVLLQQQGIKSMVHRAGLSRKYRTQVENAFRTGDLPVIVSTPTLELGIDIGDLDCVVSMIVSITRLTQRVGRAGRKGQESVAVLALREKDPISSFYRYKPDKYFTDIDAAYMEPENEVVGYYQLIAAAMTGKINISMFSKQHKIFETLEEEGIISIDEAGNVRIADVNEARKKWRSYSIRGIGDTVEIFFERKALGSRSMPMAAQELHPGAIYLHGGKSYLSVEFKYRPGLGRAKVIPQPDNRYYTKPLYFTMPRIIEVHETRQILGMNVLYCTLEMVQTVTGYVKKKTGTGEIVSKDDLHGGMLVYKYKTRGLVFRAPRPDSAVSKYLSGGKNELDGPLMGRTELYGGAFHALEHVLIESSDMLTGGGTREIGGVSMGDSGVIFVYDGSPGGNGASRLLFSRLPEAFARAETILSKCECKTVDGCPLCTYSYQCGNNNQPLFKLGALDSIRQILKGVPTSLEPNDHLGFEPLV
ncbi:MAG: DEAD/DEAH box helicase [Candidatus Thorarchaeota archaeon]